MSKSRPKIIVILGPTASGKTKLAVRLASEFKGEIISADSRQVYKGMNIGTGKDLGDYQIKSKVKSLKSKVIPYHLIDVVSPNTNFNVAKWLKLAHRAIDDIIKRGKVPFIVGGTGFYISALIEGYNLAQTKPDKVLRKKLEVTPLSQLLKKLKKLDPTAYKKVDKKNKRRVIRALEVCLSRPKKGENVYSRLQKKKGSNFDFLVLGIVRSREKTNKLIDKRVDKRLKQGMVEEVKQLHKQGTSWRRLDDFGLEYRWIGKYLQGELSKKEMTEKLKTAIHQFAKRQMTWFRKVKNVRWVKGYREAREAIKDWLGGPLINSN